MATRKRRPKDGTNMHYTATDPDMANLFQDSFKDMLYVTMEYVA